MTENLHQHAVNSVCISPGGNGNGIYNQYFSRYCIKVRYFSIKTRLLPILHCGAQHEGTPKFNLYSIL